MPTWQTLSPQEREALDQELPPRTPGPYPGRMRDGRPAGVAEVHAWIAVRPYKFPCGDVVVIGRCRCGVFGQTAFSFPTGCGEDRHRAPVYGGDVPTIARFDPFHRAFLAAVEIDPEPYVPVIYQNDQGTWTS